MVFKEGSVPVEVAARVFGKNPNWVRQGLISGWLKIGTATRKGKPATEQSSKLGRINYYISPKLLWEETGYVWGGEKDAD